MAAFSVIDVDTAEKRLWQWHDVKSWWQGLEALSENTLLLHGYADDKSGNHTGIFALDLQKRVKKWQQEALSFRGFTGSKILAAYPENFNESNLILDPASGDITGQENHVPQPDFLAENFQFPEFYGEENPYFSKLATFVNRFVPDDLVLGFDYLETSSQIIIGFYFENEAGNLQQDLIVTDLNGNLQIREVLESKCNGRGVDNFFIFRNNLIFIHNRSSLIGFML